MYFLNITSPGIILCGLLSLGGVLKVKYHRKLQEVNNRIEVLTVKSKRSL